MSMHKIPLTPIEESGLRAHGLDIGKPSQLSDAFRQGVRYARTQLPSQGGEAVEVVAYIDDGGALYTSKLLEIMSVESDGCEPLMTVAQHQRILAAATHPADQGAEIAKLRELLTAWRRMFDGGICSGPLGTLCDQTDAALAKPST